MRQAIAVLALGSRDERSWEKALKCTQPWTRNPGGLATERH